MKLLQTAHAFLFLSLLLIGGKTSMAQDIDPNFYFVIKSKSNEYNSNTQEFKRLYFSGFESSTIQLKEAELKEIHQAMKEAKFLAMPSSYAPTSEVVALVTPHFEYRLEANFQGKEKKIFYSTEVTDEQMKKDAAPFMELYVRVWEIISSNEDVQKLKKSNIRWE